jgi:hypothetical protein
VGIALEHRGDDGDDGDVPDGHRIDRERVVDTVGWAWSHGRGVSTTGSW